MAGKKLSKDIDLTEKINPADGFFSSAASAPAKRTTKKKEDEKENKTAEPKKNPAKKAGGRPKKEGLKNIQFTLTMHPERYEKLRIVAEERCGANFSRLMDEAVNSYCRENSIDLHAIIVDPEILDKYRIKQEKKKC